MTVEQAQQDLYAAMAAARLVLLSDILEAEQTYLTTLQAAADTMQNSTDPNRFNQYILAFNTATQTRKDAMGAAAARYEIEVAPARQNLATAMGEAYAAHDAQKQYTTPQASVDQPVSGDHSHGPG